MVVCLKEVEWCALCVGGVVSLVSLLLTKTRRKSVVVSCLSFLFALCVDDFGDYGKKRPLALTRLEASHPQDRGRALR